MHVWNIMLIVLTLCSFFIIIYWFFFIYEYHIDCTNSVALFLNNRQQNLAWHTLFQPPTNLWDILIRVTMMKLMMMMWWLCIYAVHLVSSDICEVVVKDQPGFRLRSHRAQGGERQGQRRPSNFPSVMWRHYWLVWVDGKEILRYQCLWKYLLRWP